MLGDTFVLLCPYSQHSSIVAIHKLAKALPFTALQQGVACTAKPKCVGIRFRIKSMQFIMIPVAGLGCVAKDVWLSCAPEHDRKD